MPSSSRSTTTAIRFPFTTRRRLHENALPHGLFRSPSSMRFRPRTSRRNSKGVHRRHRPRLDDARRGRLRQRQLRQGHLELEDGRLGPLHRQAGRRDPHARRPVHELRAGARVEAREAGRQLRRLRLGAEGVARRAQEPGSCPAASRCRSSTTATTSNYEKDGKKKADWFTTNGDVFPVGNSKMKPFPPVVARTAARSFPRKETTHGFGKWNHYYVRAINGEVRLWVNGEEVSGGTDANPRPATLPGVGRLADRVPQHPDAQAALSSRPCERRNQFGRSMSRRGRFGRIRLRPSAV